MEQRKGLVLSLSKGYALLSKSEVLALYSAVWLCFVSGVGGAASTMLLYPEAFRSLFIGTAAVLVSYWLRRVALNRRLFNSLIVSGTFVLFLFDLIRAGVPPWMWLASSELSIFSLSAYDALRLIMSGLMSLYALRCLAVLDAKDAVVTLIPGLSIFILCLPMERSLLLMLFFAPFALGAIVLLMLSHTEELRRSAGGLVAVRGLEQRNHIVLLRTVCRVGGWVLVLSVLLSWLLTSFVSPSPWMLKFQDNLTEALANRLAGGTLLSGPYPVLSLRALNPSSSQKVIMRVDSDVAGYWRVLSYDCYSGTGWRRTLRWKPLSPNRVVVLQPGELKAPTSFERAPSLLARQLYRFEGNYIGALPTLLEPVRIEGIYGLLRRDNAGCIISTRQIEQGTEYTVISRVNIASPSQTDSQPFADGKGLPPSERQRYLQLPPLTPRLVRLTEKITANAKTPFQKVKAVRRFLSERFDYTLSPPPLPPDREAVDFFVFEGKRGSCVHFATAMAVMCRIIGVPSRIVSGFRTGIYDPKSMSYVVRESDAHTWTEVFLPETGWIAVEPSPAFSLPPPKRLKSKHATTLKVLSWLSSLLDSARQSFKREWKRMLLGCILLTAVAVVMVSIRRSMRFARLLVGWLADSKQANQLTSQIQCGLKTFSAFQSACRLLRKRFRQRHPAETVLEYAAALREALGKSEVTEIFDELACLFLQALYRSAPSAEEEEQANALLHRLRKSLRRSQTSISHQASSIKHQD